MYEYWCKSVSEMVCIFLQNHTIFNFHHPYDSISSASKTHFSSASNSKSSVFFLEFGFTSASRILNHELALVLEFQHFPLILELKVRIFT